MYSYLIVFQNLSEWGLADNVSASVSFSIGGTQYSDVYVEQAYKGNYHLHATAGGKSRKFVIGSGKEEYDIIASVGALNLTEEQLKSLVAKYMA